MKGETNGREELRRYTIEPNGHDHFKFVIHDNETDEPLCWCMNEADAKIVEAALAHIEKKEIDSEDL